MEFFSWLNANQGVIAAANIVVVVIIAYFGRGFFRNIVEIKNSVKNTEINTGDDSSQTNSGNTFIITDPVVMKQLIKSQQRPKK